MEPPAGTSLVEGVVAPGMGVLIGNRPRRAAALGQAQHASALRLRPVVERGGKKERKTRGRVSARRNLQRRSLAC